MCRNGLIINYTGSRKIEVNKLVSPSYHELVGLVLKVTGFEMW